tara:strand:- start:256 stop:705 length:450 start_codon:yes stop_codon:yes gene_type:complete
VVAVARAEMVKLEDPVVAEVDKVQVQQVHLMKVTPAETEQGTQVVEAEEPKQQQLTHQDLVKHHPEQMDYNLQLQDHKSHELVVAAEAVKDSLVQEDQVEEDKVVPTQLVQHLQDKELLGKQTLVAVEVDLTTIQVLMLQEQVVAELLF